MHAFMRTAWPWYRARDSWLMPDIPVLLFDFQANGESLGTHQTFGYLESLDARAACEYLRSRVPGSKIGVIGLSLGGAAAILAKPPLDVDALVLEAVYPTIEEATANRIAARLGTPGRFLTPLLTAQLRPRLGISPADLRPIEHMSDVKAPVFVVAGGADVDTTPLESRRLFQAASHQRNIGKYPVLDTRISMRSHIKSTSARSSVF
jgi:pimeloyl-ACP methyl ester carboxylesterase